MDDLASETFKIHQSMTGHLEFKAGFEARDKIAQEREAMLIDQRNEAVRLDVNRWAYQYGHDDITREAKIKQEIKKFDEELDTLAEHRKESEG